MKTTFRALAVIGCLILLSSSVALAATITWSDNTIYWPGWPATGVNAYKNGVDALGTPDVLGGTVVTSATGYITSVTANFAAGTWPYFVTPTLGNAYTIPGDLFVDANGDGTWDYVVSLYNGNDNTDETAKYLPSVAYTTDLGYFSASGDVPVYDISGLNLHWDTNVGAGYLIVNDAGYFAGDLVRVGHPFAVTGITSSPLGEASVIGGPGLTTSLLTYTIPDGLIPGSAIIGFTENCANDVQLISTVPEPSALLLLGTGLVLVGLKIRKR